MGGARADFVRHSSRGWRIRRSGRRRTGVLCGPVGKDRSRQNDRRRRAKARLASSGSIFGEVPLALGTSFPAGYRASEPSRVMRVETPQYYALAASSPDFAKKMGALARERLGGLQAIAAEPHQPRLLMVAPRWDSVCAELRRFLDRNQVHFQWLTPDAPQLRVSMGRSAPEGRAVPCNTLLRWRRAPSTDGSRSRSSRRLADCFARH